MLFVGGEMERTGLYDAGDGSPVLSISPPTNKEI